MALLLFLTPRLKLSIVLRLEARGPSVWQNHCAPSTFSEIRALPGQTNIASGRQASKFTLAKGNADDPCFLSPWLLRPGRVLRCARAPKLTPHSNHDPTSISPAHSLSPSSGPAAFALEIPSAPSPNRIPHSIFQFFGVYPSTTRLKVSSVQKLSSPSR
jgi:hypothetical protein